MRAAKYTGITNALLARQGLAFEVMRQQAGFPPLMVGGQNILSPAGADPTMRDIECIALQLSLFALTGKYLLREAVQPVMTDEAFQTLVRGAI